MSGQWAGLTILLFLILALVIQWAKNLRRYHASHSRRLGGSRRTGVGLTDWFSSNSGYSMINSLVRTFSVGMAGTWALQSHGSRSQALAV